MNIEGQNTPQRLVKGSWQVRASEAGEVGPAMAGPIILEWSHADSNVGGAISNTEK